MNKHLSHYPKIKTIIAISIIPCALFLLLLVMPRPSYKDGFKTLDQISTYAKMLNENFKLDTDNTITPDFSSYYATLVPTWKSNLKEKINWLLSFIKITVPPLWSPNFFKELLIQTTKQREKGELKGNVVCKLIPTTQSKIVIFGNVQGAFHSLTRCLQKIRELGIIGDDLKITNQDNFIIFMGNIIDRSPYSMETLTVVMKIIYLNPSNVIYLQGNHEAHNYWQEQSLKPELQAQAAHLSKGVIPLVDEINNFFNTLPLACYISTLNDGGTDFIRISDSARGQNELLNEQSYAKFLTSKILQSCICFNLKDKTEEATGESSIDIKVMFEGEKKREKYQPHEGLRFLAPDMGSTAWTVLSCPTPVYQKAIKFVHDAFVVLTAAKNLDEWKITLYNRNVLTQAQFKATTFYLLSGAEEGAPGSEKTVAPEKIQKPKQEKPAEVPKEKVSKPSPVKPDDQPVFDTSTSTTIQEDVASISKHAQAITQQAEIIAKKLKATPQQQPAPETKVPQKDTSTEVVAEQESAFEPISPQENVKHEQE